MEGRDFEMIYDKAAKSLKRILSPILSVELSSSFPVTDELNHLNSYFKRPELLNFTC